MNRHSLPLALTLTAVLAAGAFAQQEEAPATAPPPPCESEKHRHFDFWIGEWTVTAPTGQTAGENTIERILNGCVLLESWRGAEGSIGRSFNMYDARTDQWRQTWVDGAGSRLDLAGGLDEQGRMVLRGETPGRQGGRALHEIAWTPNPDGTVRQYWRASQDGGATWNDLFDGTYTKK
jgi:hypothetical protein